MFRKFIRRRNELRYLHQPITYVTIMAAFVILLTSLLIANSRHTLKTVKRIDMSVYRRVI